MYTLSEARYNDIVDDALVDAYSAEEQFASFAVMLQENVELPIVVSIVGSEATIADFDNDDSRVLAKIKLAGKDYTFDLRDVDVKECIETEWIMAYKRWRRGW